MALEVSDNSKIPITKNTSAKIRNGDMTGKDIREAIVGADKKADPCEVKETVREKREKKGKTVRLSVGIYEKYFRKNNDDEIHDIVEKAIIAWFKSKR